MMLFSSIVFLLFFLPLVIAGNSLLQLWIQRKGIGRSERASNLFLLAASLLFYLWGEPRLVLVLMASCLVNFWCALRMERPGAARKLWLAGALTLDLGALFYFKYFNFFMDNGGLWLWNLITPEFLQLDGIRRIVLPLGISFYTFQAVSYVIDVYRGRVRPTGSLVDFSCYLTMFPQLVAGPIVRYSLMARQLTRRGIELGRFSEGISRFILGLAKKVLIANNVASMADAVFDTPATALGPGIAWLGCLCYTIQIYYDFSGYSDMAVGLGRMLGFRFPENFFYPYSAVSMQDFWRRWHMTLTVWLRDYLYIPLGGNRCGKFRTLLNTGIVFLCCGLWHGASWMFVAWGAFHGIFMVLERLLKPLLVHAWPKSPVGRAVLKLIGHLYVLLVVIIGWVLFRSADGGQAMALYKALLGLNAGEAVQAYAWLMWNPWVALALGAGMLFAFPSAPMVRQEAMRLTSSAGGLVFIGMARLAGLMTLLFVCLMELGAGTYNPFIYFRF